MDRLTTDNDGFAWHFDDEIPEDERRFYMKAYSNLNNITERKVHCTVCQEHIGTAPSQESILRMHPILRITHCEKCHLFYSSGDFDKGEDGSELYCRWCGQGGQVYCCSKCPFVFCKPCIVSNLSAGVITDIENNENWSCFNCAPKIIWPLRAQHWALVNYIEKQKVIIMSGNHTELEVKKLIGKDTSSCCRGKLEAKSSESKLPDKRMRRLLPKDGALEGGHHPVKKMKLGSGIVCTPDIMQMLEPIRKPIVSPKNVASKPRTYVPRNENAHAASTSKRSAQGASTPPLVVVRNPNASPQIPASIIRKTSPTATPQTSVFHTINGFRIDLNSAARHETFRLPNGKLIQVKRQNSAKTSTVTSSTTNLSTTTVQSVSTNAVPPSVRVNSSTIIHSNQQVFRGQIQPRSSTVTQVPTQLTQFAVQHSQTQSVTATATPPIQQMIGAQQQQVSTVRYSSQAIQSNSITNLQSGTIQVINSHLPTGSGVSIRQMAPIVKQQYGQSTLGRTRAQLQAQIVNTWDICLLMNGKIQSFTNSNAYKNVRNNTDIKELYIHLSYLLSYAIGRFKGLQDKCLADMRSLGFNIDADSLENGKLAADKQASDDEDGEIEIVEPHRDTINLDSDDDEEPVVKPSPKVISSKENSSLQQAQVAKVLNKTTGEKSEGVALKRYHINISSKKNSLANSKSSDVVNSKPKEVQLPNIIMKEVRQSNENQLPNTSVSELQLSETVIKEVQQPKNDHVKEVGSKVNTFIIRPISALPKKPPVMMEVDPPNDTEDDPKLNMHCVVILPSVENMEIDENETPCFDISKNSDDKVTDPKEKITHDKNMTEGDVTMDTINLNGSDTISNSINDGEKQIVDVEPQEPIQSCVNQIKDKFVVQQETEGNIVQNENDQKDIVNGQESEFSLQAQNLPQPDTDLETGMYKELDAIQKQPTDQNSTTTQKSSFEEEKPLAELAPETEGILDTKIIPETEVIPETILETATKVIPETILKAATKVIPEPILQQSTKVVVVPETVLEPTTKLVPDSVLVSVTNVVPETVLVPVNVSVPLSDVAPEIFLVPKTVLDVETKVIPESNFVPAIDVVPENDFVAETKLISETVLVPDIVLVPKTDLVPKSEMVPETILVLETELVPEKENKNCNKSVCTLEKSGIKINGV